METKKIIEAVILLLIAGLLIGGYFKFTYSPYKFTGHRPIKIFHLDSFMPSFNQSAEVADGFEKYLEGKKISFEMKDFYMYSVDRITNLTLRADEAVSIIHQWKPDLIFAVGDEAQRDVVSKYFVNSKIPVVFSEVNLYPETYGYDKARNVAGVFEREGLKNAVDFLRKIYYKNINKIAVVGDEYFLSSEVMAQLKKQAPDISNVEFVSWQRFSKFEDYKRAILNYQDNADAFILLPALTIVDQNGSLVTDADAVRWIDENSKIPEVTFWGLPVYQGMLAAVQVLPYEVGEDSAKIAKEILIDGKKPSSIPFQQPNKWKQFINSARAKALDIKGIPSALLVNSEVYDRFPWE